MIGVRQTLEQVRRKISGAVAVEVAKSSGDGRNGEAVCESGGGGSSPSGLG